MKNYSSKRIDAVVAGHICLDVIPTLDGRTGGLGALMVPGKLVECGRAVLSAGGVVANTGLALNRLGFGARLIGKVGDDAFGRAVFDLLRLHGAELASGMISARGESSSYSIVISPPGVDRIFLHCPGANDTFTSRDVGRESLADARLFHFGYPPIMRMMYADGGRELEKIMRRAKKSGLTTSLDMSRPDPDTDAGRADWREILTRVLPHVDVFLPSFDEILFMLDRKQHAKLEKAHGSDGIIGGIDGALAERLTGELIAMGVAIAGLKLGDRGLLIRTSPEQNRLAKCGICAPAAPEEWTSRRLYSPCFKVKVAGATGAGDSTIAGFLAGLLEGFSPEDALTTAVAVGACSVEQHDAVSGIPNLRIVQKRISSGWKRHGCGIALDGY